jgi:hypothetical protein
VTQYRGLVDDLTTDVLLNTNHDAGKFRRRTSPPNAISAAT